MGIAAKLDQLQNLRQLDDAAAALPIPKAVDDAPVDAGDVRKAAPTVRAVDSDMFNAFVTGIAEDLRAGEPVNPQALTRARAMWLAMPPKQKKAIIKVEGNGAKIVQALEGTPHNMLGDVEPDALLSRANLASKEQFPEGLPKRDKLASIDIAQGKVPRATADDVRGINRSIEGLLIDNKLQGKRHKELQNKLTGMGYEVLPTDDGNFRVRLPRPEILDDGTRVVKKVDGNWRPLIEGFQKDLPEIPDKQLRADRRAARTAQTGQPARDQVLIDKRMEPRGADPTSGKVVGDKVTGELGRQTENDFGYLPSERNPQRQVAGDLATTASGGAQVNPVAPITHKGGNPLENVIAKEVTPGSSPNAGRMSDLQRQLEVAQSDWHNARAFKEYKDQLWEKADEILDKLDNPDLDPATRKALELENQKLMSSYTEEVAKERQLRPGFDPTNPEKTIQQNLSRVKVLRQELDLQDANVDPLFEPDSQTPRIYRDSDVPQSPTEAEDLGVIGEFQETGGRSGVGGGQRRDSDRIAAMEEFFTEQKRLPKEDEINPATGELYFPDGKPLGMGMKAESLRPIHTFFKDVDGVPARFKDVDDAAYKFAIYQGHAPGTKGFDAAMEGFKRTLDRFMDGRDPTLPTAKTLDKFDDTADATEAMSNNPAVLDRNRAAQPGPDPEVDPLAPSTFKPATPVGTPVERRPMIVDPVTGRTGKLLEDLRPRLDMPEKPETFDPKNNAIHKGLSEPPHNIKTQEQFNRHVYRENFSPEPKQRPEPPVDTRPELGPEVPLDDPFDGDPNAIPVETSARGKPAGSPIIDSRGRDAKKVKGLKETLDDADSSTKKTPRLDPDTQTTIDADEYSEAVKSLKKKGNRKKGEPNKNTALSNEDLKRISRGEAHLDGGEVVDGPPPKDFEDLEPLSGADDMDNRDLPPMDEYEVIYDEELDPSDISNYEDAELTELIGEADSLGLDMQASRNSPIENLRKAVENARKKAGNATKPKGGKKKAKKATGSKSQKDSLADDNLDASDPNKQVIDDVEPLDDAANPQKKTTDKSEEKKVDDAGDADFITDKEEPVTSSGGGADSTPDQNPRRQPKQADKSGSGKGKKGWLRRGAELGGVLGAGALGIFALQQALGPRGAGSITGGGPEGVRKDEGSVSGGGDSGVLPGETMSRDEELDAAASLQKIRDARRAAAGGGDRRLQTTHNFIGRSKGRF